MGEREEKEKRDKKVYTFAQEATSEIEKLLHKYTMRLQREDGASDFLFRKNVIVNLIINFCVACDMFGRHTAHHYCFNSKSVYEQIRSEIEEALDNTDGIIGKAYQETDILEMIKQAKREDIYI